MLDRNSRVVRNMIQNSSGKGAPPKNEGKDGDIQVRSANKGIFLFGKVGGRWYKTTPLTISSGKVEAKNTTIENTQKSGGRSGIAVDGSGNVGIHTSNPDSDLHIKSAGDVVLHLEADTDNATETDNPLIKLNQDGGLVIGTIGMSNGNNLVINNTFDDASSDVVIKARDAEIIRFTGDSIVDINAKLSIGDGTELTISASGAITVTQGYHTVDTESDDPSDTLTTINGGVTGMILILKAANDGRSIIVTKDTGNIRILNNYTLNNINDTIMLVYDGSNWLGVSDANNGT
mgnify:CR=1 FL=1